MPTTFEQTLTRSADSFFLLPGREWVTYVPRSGPSRRVEAVIVRTAVEPIPGVVGATRPVVDLLVRNRSDTGISSDEVDTGGDRIRIAPNVNEKPIVMHVTLITEQSAGILTLRVQG
jgi:hypothetical protein